MAEMSLIQLLEDLVAIPSVTPGGAYDESFTGEARMAEYLAEYLTAAGFELTWDERESGRPNLIAAYGPQSAERSLLIEGHLDTVGVAGMSRSAFEPVEEGGRLYGRGACDTKGPMAAALWALTPETLERLAAAGFRTVFVGAMGEEAGNQGAERLVARGLVRAEFGIVLEPTELAIVHAHKGSLWFKLVLRGVAGHGSDPDAGVNAIDGMCDAIAALHKEVAGARERVRSALLGSPTVNIGTIQGGSAINIVADSCALEVDRRTLPEESHRDILQTLSQKLDALQEEGRFSSYRIEIVKDGAPFETSKDSRLVNRLRRSCEEAGVAPRTEGTAWFSDAGPLAQVCDEIVVFGPGSIKQAHTADEYIELEQLRKGAEVLQAFFNRLSASRSGR